MLRIKQLEKRIESLAFELDEAKGMLHDLNAQLGAEKMYRSILEEQVEGLIKKVNPEPKKRGRKPKESTKEEVIEKAKKQLKRNKK